MPRRRVGLLRRASCSRGMVGGELGWPVLGVVAGSVLSASVSRLRFITEIGEKLGVKWP